MRSFFAIALAGTVSAMSSLDFKFMKWITEHNKPYATVGEYEHRFALWQQAEKEIQEHNRQHFITSYMGHNYYSDWSQEELSQLTGYLNLPRLSEGPYAEFTPVNEDSVDWVAKGAVTEVKNQGTCGSCWSFSTTGSMEGAHFIATGELLSLSEQQLVSCSHNGNLGCMGGMMDRAFTWTETNKLETEADYPYKGWLGQAAGCKTDESKAKVGATSYVDVTPSNSAALKAQIAKGPVSVAIQANQAVFQRYTGGIISSGCGTKLDHGVLAVGYGVENGVEFYKVKNSWGPSWGEDGYVRLAIQDGDGAQEFLTL